MTAFPAVSLPGAWQGTYFPCRIAPRETMQAIAGKQFYGAGKPIFGPGGEVFPCVSRAAGKKC
jgi:hypothetical protein